MFHLPDLCEEALGGFRPSVHVVHPEQSYHHGHCQAESRPRCRRQPWPGTMWHGQPSGCCAFPAEEEGYKEPGVLDFLQPLMASLGATGGVRASPLNQGHPHGRRSRCRQSSEFQTPECSPENLISSVIDQLTNIGGNNMEASEDNPFSNVIHQVLGALKTPGSSKWQYQIDCSGFKSNNIFVKMVKGELVVKATKNEKCCDGSVSVKSIEKRIPIPKDVITKKISCRMLPNSILKVEGPRENQQTSQNCNATEQKSSAQEKKASEKKAHPNIDVKALPNGGMVFTTLFPGFNNLFGDMTENKSDGTNATTAGNQHDDGSTYKEKKTAIPVHFVNKACSIQKDSAQPTAKPSVQEPKHSLCNQISQTEEECPRASAVADEETLLLRADDQYEDAAPKEPESANIDCNESYTVELAESEDDAASTNSKDSENSFVLLSTDREDPTDEKEIKVDDIADSISETTEAQHNDEENKQTPADETQGANQLNDITKFITNTIPNLQNLIVNMNNADKTNQGEINGLQGAAKIISEAFPNLQNVITAKKSKTEPNDAPKSSKPDVSDSESNRAQGEEFNVRLEMPLCNPESIHVTMDDEQRLLNITARKGGSRGDGSSGEGVTKSIEVPQSANISQLRCQFRDGLLNISAPYKEGTRNTRNIPVQV